MLQIAVMIAIAAAAFWWLPIFISGVIGLVVFFLIAGKLRDAANKGRRFMKRRKDAEDEEEADYSYGREASFIGAMWVGLTVSEAIHTDTGYSEGGYLSDYNGGGYDGGGFDSGGDGGGGE